LIIGTDTNPHSRVFNATADGVPQEIFETAVRLERTRMMTYQIIRKCDDMCNRLYTIPALDRQTDGQREMVKQYRAPRASAC